MEPLSVRATIVAFVACLALAWISGVIVEASTQYGTMLP